MKPGRDTPTGDRPLDVAVLASGSGSNFQVLLDRFHGREGSPVRVGLLVASRPGIRALERAARAGVETAVLPEVGDEADALLSLFGAVGADLVVLAGWLRLVPARVVRAYWGRMLNLHPALLPAFGGEGMYGLRVHRAVLEAGVRVTGATVHFVDERYDRGPIVAQWPVPVREGDAPEDLAARVLEVEHRLLPAVVEAMARGAVALDEDGRCRWRDDWFTTGRFEMPGGEGRDPTAAGLATAPSDASFADPPAAPSRPGE